MLACPDLSFFPDGQTAMQKRNALLGALVADAATLGLHWLYDHARLSRIAAAGPVMFRKPAAADFKDAQGYFAHAGKEAGDSSQYGHACLLAGKAVGAEGSYDLVAHQIGYLQVFGPGGSWVGYADKVNKGVVARLLAEGADGYPDPSGVDDDQLPAIAATPALFAAGCTQAALTAAVSMTNVNTDAAAAAAALLAALTAVASGNSAADALAGAAQECSCAKMKQSLAEALQMKPLDAQAAAARFGMSCRVSQGMPVAWHIVANAEGFEQALEANIMAGGDNCGRALAVGSLAGLLFGVPADLITKTKIIEFNERLLPRFE